MKKVVKVFSVFMFAFVMICAVACGNKKENKNCDVAEKVELGKATISEVEFENADTVKLKQDCDTVVVSGTIDAMSTSQKNVYGVEEVTHAVVLKFTFDKERTLSSFEIKGEKVKVFGADDSVENYSGTLTDILDNEAGEDAYTYLVLSANTKNYELKAVYSDETESVVKINITATLATAEAE